MQIALLLRQKGAQSIFQTFIEMKKRIPRFLGHYSKKNVVFINSDIETKLIIVFIPDNRISNATFLFSRLINH